MGFVFGKLDGVGASRTRKRKEGEKSSKRMGEPPRIYGVGMVGRDWAGRALEVRFCGLIG